MNKLLKIILGIYGVMFVLFGIIKLFGQLEYFKIETLAGVVSLPNSMSSTYIIIVNIIGGLSMAIHSFSTLKFNSKLLHPPIVNDNSNLKPLNTIEVWTGVISVILAFFLIVKSISQLTAFSGAIEQLIFIFLPLVFFYAFQGIAPIIIFATNYNLNEEIIKIIRLKRKNVAK